MRSACAMRCAGFLFAAWAAILVGCARPPSFTGTVLTPRPAPDFTLTAGDGRAFWLDSERGKAVILFFGYTHCPDVCPTTLAQLRLVVKALPAAEQSRVAVLFVTVDPQRDDPATMQRFVRLFDPRFVGLTGSPDRLAPVLRAYHVFHQRLPGKTAAGYLVAHTGAVYLIDPDGDLRVMHSWQDPPHAIAADVHALLS